MVFLYNCTISVEKRCEGIDCPTQLTAQDCKEGMYFEQGPSYYSDCCPLSGSCVCNMSVCPSPPECNQSNSSLVIVTAEAEESSQQCCDQYECQTKGILLYSHVDCSFTT